MNLKELVQKSRSYRRFDSSVAVSGNTLRDLIELARYVPNGSNRQSLKFWLSNTPEMNEVIFPCLKWAGALKNWDGPAKGERPAACVIVLGDTTIQPEFGFDPGVAAQTIKLGATEKGLGGCIIGSFRKKTLQKGLDIPEHLKILLVLALGKPAETVVTEPLGEDGDIRYYRDAEDVHRVPKRELTDLIVHDV